QGDFAVAAEAGTAAEALEALRSRFQAYQQALDDPALRKKDKPPQTPIDLVILDLGLGAKNPDAMPGLQLCQQIKTEFPSLPVLVLSTQAEPVLQAAAERMGANGYGTRSMPVRRLAQLIRQVSAGSAATSRSDASRSDTSRSEIDNSQIDDARSNRSQTDSLQPNDSQSDRANLGTPQPVRPPAAASPTSLSKIPGPLTAMRISMRLSALQQIDQNLSELALARRRTRSWLNQAILDGKKRELTAARWLVSAIWRTPGFRDSPRGARRQRTGEAAGASLSGSTDWIRAAQQGGYGGQNYGDITAARYLDRDLLVPGAIAALSNSEAQLQAQPGSVQNAVFEGVFAKLQRPLKNISESPLEIDILRSDKKLELLYLVLRQLEELLADLRASEMRPGQLSMRSAQVVQDLWDAVNREFFGKYYTVRIGNVEEEVVTLLQREKPLVEAQILNRIPMVSELFGHWLFQEPMVIDGSSYVATTPRAIAHSERLLENLMIQVANAVVQPLLNRLADSEPIKKSLYTGRLMSSR
ncbi:MAG: DUF3685 domain-containing protein, partial [Phormidesmis sp.]